MIRHFQYYPDGSVTSWDENSALAEEHDKGLMPEWTEVEVVPVGSVFVRPVDMPEIRVGAKGRLEASNGEWLPLVTSVESAEGWLATVAAVVRYLREHPPVSSEIVKTLDDDIKQADPHMGLSDRTRLARILAERGWRVPEDQS